MRDHHVIIRFEEFYSECHPRLERFAPDFAADTFLRVCQGLSAAGGGHRRAQRIEGAVPAEATEPSV
jgi:hypothetical protein